jgi:hypothetical protein
MEKAYHNCESCSPLRDNLVAIVSSSQNSKDPPAQKKGLETRRVPRTVGWGATSMSLLAIDPWISYKNIRTWTYIGNANRRGGLS